MATGTDDQERAIGDAGERFGALWLAVGLAAFGLVVGVIAGLSAASGTAAALISALFSFVGGVVLAFGGFVVRGQGGLPTISGRRLGSALAGFSLGVLVGANSGILLREVGSPLLSAWVNHKLNDPHRQRSEAVATAGAPEGERQPELVAVKWQFQSTKAEFCKRLTGNQKLYATPEQGCELARQDSTLLGRIICADQKL